jgi:hypothetical protein
MNRDEKLMHRFLEKPRDFTRNELSRLLTSIGFMELTTGKTAGSKRVFQFPKTGLILRLHKPHPGNELKLYQVNLVHETLERGGLL